MEASQLRCPPAPLTGYDLVAAHGVRPDQDRLDEALLADGFRELGKVLLAEVAARIQLAAPNLVDRHDPMLALRRKTRRSGRRLADQ
jgi:hypothetical protein